MQTMTQYITNIYLNVWLRLYDNNKYMLKRLIADGDTKSIVQFLECNADAHTRSLARNPKYYDEILKWSAQNEHMEIVHVLLKHGAKVTFENGDALLYGVRNNHLEVVIALLQCCEHSLLNTALMIAADKGNLEIVNALLKFGDQSSLNSAQIKYSNQSSLNSALMIAVRNGHLEIITALLNHGADVHVGREDPLFESVCNGNLAVVTVLLEAGASALCDRILNGNYNRFLNHAFTSGYCEIVAALLEHGVSVYSGDEMVLRRLQEQFDERMADVVVRNVPISSSKSCS